MARTRPALLLVLTLCLWRESCSFHRTFGRSRPRLSKRSRAGSVRMVYSMDQESDLKSALDRGDPEAALVELRELRSLEPELAAQALDLCARPASDEVRDPVTGSGFSMAELSGQMMVSAAQEARLQRCYEQLRRLGLASKFAVEFGATPVSSAVGMTTNGLEQRTGLPLSAFRPSPATGRMYLLGGVGLSVVEVLLARQLGISPQPLFLLTALVLGIDQVLLGGAVFETLLSSVRPEIKNRVVYHEAGHLLLAYLLGCPVQSVTLSAIETLQRTSIGVLAPGTAFFDAELNRSAQTGIISRDTLDRYSIVVMGGIAAEAMVFGAAEGGRDDERTLIEFLQRNVASNTGGFGMDQVAEQARWSAVNAIELLRKHRDMYDRLVAILEKNRGESIGACILEMEGHPVTS